MVERCENRETRGIMTAWYIIQTAFQPAMSSWPHMLLMSEIVCEAIMRHRPTATFSSAERLEYGVLLRAVARRNGRWSTIRRFWYLQCMTALGVLRNSGHELLGVVPGGLEKSMALSLAPEALEGCIEGRYLWAEEWLRL